jgi:hypothetical protein
LIFVELLVSKVLDLKNSLCEFHRSVSWLFRQNARQLKPLSSMMIAHRPAWMITGSMPIIHLKSTCKKNQLKANR